MFVCVYEFLSVVSLSRLVCIREGRFIGGIGISHRLHGWAGARLVFIAFGRSIVCGLVVFCFWSLGTGKGVLMMGVVLFWVLRNHYCVFVFGFGLDYYWRMNDDEVDDGDY